MRETVFLVALLWVGCCEFAQGQAAHSPANCKNDRQRMLRVESLEDGGWDVSFIQKPTAVKKHPYGPDKRDLGFNSIAYEIQRRVVTITEVSVNICEKTAAVGTLSFIPEHVSAIEKDGRVFAYIVWAQMVSGSGPETHVVGAKMNVIYYDTHGTGKFDLVQAMAPAGLPFVPDWVK